MLRKSSHLPVFFTVLLVLLGTAGAQVGKADGSYEDYLSALKFADAEVKRKKALRDPPPVETAARPRRGGGSGSVGGISAALVSTSTLEKLLGRGYKVGDSWDVAAVRIDKVDMRRLDDSEQLIPRAEAVGIFRYRVKESRGGKIVVSVTQVEGDGRKAVDPKIAELSLTLNPDVAQTEKAYRMAESGEWVRVSPNGLRSRVTPLELFPLDVPDLTYPDGRKVNAVPELPPSLRDLVGQNTVAVDLAKSLWFEQDDFFGRAVQLIWQNGDPWPAFMATPQGVAVLLRKELQ